MKSIEIIPFDPLFKDYFILLNLSWLIKYDVLEPVDKEMLNNPYDMIIEKGGMIFLAQTHDHQIAGTISVLNQGDGIFEIVKFGVSPDYQSEGIGKLLFEKALEYTQENNAKKVELYTHTNLEAAIGLYKKYGFEEVSMDNNHYETVDMKMVKQ